MRQGGVAIKKLRSGARCASVQTGPAAKAKLGNTIGYYVSAQARRLGHKDAFRVPHQGVSWTYIDVKKNVEALANGMHKEFLRAGDRVLCVQPSTAEQWVIQLASAKVGAVTVLADPYKASLNEIQGLLNTYQPSWAIIREFTDAPDAEGSPRKLPLHELFYQSIPEMDQSLGYRKYVRSQQYPWLHSVFTTDYNEELHGSSPLRDILEWGPFDYYTQPLRLRARLLHADLPCLMIGDITYTHRNLMTQGYYAAKHLGLTSDSKLAVSPGIQHTFGGTLAQYASFAAGGCLSVCGEHLFHDSHVGTFLETLEVEKSEGLLISKDQLDLITPAVAGSPEGVGKLKWVAVVDGASSEVLKATQEAFKVDTVFNFSGPTVAQSALHEKLMGGSLSTVVAPNLSVKGDAAKGEAAASRRWTAAGTQRLPEKEGFVSAA